MVLSILSGTVSHIEHAAAAGSTNRHSCSFRIGNRSVMIWLPRAANLNEGDRVTVSGRETVIGFVGHAVHNETTSATYLASPCPSWALRIGGGLLVLIGLPLLLMLIGIPLVLGGLWLFYKARRNSKALALLGRRVSRTNCSTAFR